MKSVSQLPSDLSLVRRVILPLDIDAKTVDSLKEKKIQPAVEVPAAVFGGGSAVYNAIVNARKNGVSLAAVCSLDGAAIAKKAGMKLCALPGTNIFNTFSLDEFERLGFTDAVLSTELKLTQCAALGGHLPRGVFAYGRLPLMQTRNCPVKNGTTCAQCRKHGFLTDRMGVKFPVECTPFASALLNSVPVVESDKREQFEFSRCCGLRPRQRTNAKKFSKATAGATPRRANLRADFSTAVSNKRRHIMLTLKMKKMRPGAIIPKRATSGSAGLDLCACTEGEVVLKAGERTVIPTGIAIAIENNETAAFIYARSGLGIKHGISLSNGVGVIDSDYRGEICVGLINTSNEDYAIQPGERIAQLVLAPVIPAEPAEVESLDETERGAGGFGSTGR